MRDKERTKEKQMMEEEIRVLRAEVEKMQLSSPRVMESLKLLESAMSRVDDANPELKEELRRALDSVSSCKNYLVPSQTFVATPKSPVKAAKGSPTKVNAKDMKALLDEVQKLKLMNTQLIAKVEERDAKVRQLETKLKAAKSKVAEVKATEEKKEEESRTWTLDLEEVKKMEKDLQRKTDLLAEVKVLLKKAAERERSQLKENDELRKKLKVMLDVHPKTPNEVLAKELRQTKLTVERLECEKRELEYKLSIADS